MTDEKLDGRVVELLCARLCHDLISPVSAIGNGAELVLEMGETVGKDAMELIAQSAGEASRKLQFFRIAFGSARGSSGSSATLADARAGFLDLPVGERISLAWQQTPDLARPVPREATKMVLNLALTTIDCLAGSGLLQVETRETPQAVQLDLIALGERAKIPGGHRGGACRGGGDRGFVAEDRHGLLRQLSGPAGGRLLGERRAAGDGQAELSDTDDDGLDRGADCGRFHRDAAAVFLGIAQHVAAAPHGLDVVLAVGRVAPASCAACRRRRR